MADGARARTRAELAERAERIAKLDAAKTRFYENVSHEFRTPLTVLHMAMEVLAPHLDDVARAQLGMAARAVDRLDELVDALSTFVKTQAHTLEPHFEPVDLRQATLDVVAMFPTVAASAGLSLTSHIDPVGEAEVDPEAWSCIVANLVSNGVKYTERGGVTVRLSQTDDGVRLEVTDTGVGIADVDRDVIFGRFRRGEAGREKDSQGLGLGLALVDDLVRAHSGTIKVRSRAHGGTAFVVELPRARRKAGSHPAAPLVSGLPAPSAVATEVVSEVAPDKPADTVGTSPGASTDTAAGTSADASRGRLLLVEDDEDLRTSLTRLLTADGWHVTAVPSVPGAVALNDPPDLVLTDIVLPGPSGLDLVRLLRGQPGWGRLPIVLLTARAGSDAIIEGLTAGADDYIVKPFHSRELRARLAVHHEMAQRREKALRDSESRAENLQTALTTNRRIGLGLGILMSRYRVTDEVAFAMLRRISNDSNRPIRDVAEEVIFTGSLEPGTETSPSSRAAAPS